MKKTLYVSLVAGSILAAGARAQQTFSYWVGPVNGNFNSIANWNNHIVPDAPGEVFLLNGGSAALSAPITVDKFGLGGGTLAVPNSLSLSVLTQAPDGVGVTGIFGGGTLTLNAVQYSTILMLSGGQAGYTATFGDAGLGISTIAMSNSPNNIITTNVAGVVFINEGVIQGAGQVGANALTIQNSHLAGGPPALIQAIYPENALVIDPPAGGFRNLDSILRSNGGTLILRNGTFVNEGGGRIDISGSAADSVVQLDGARIEHGLLRSAPNPGWYFWAVNSPRLVDLTVDATVRVANSHVLYLEGSIGTGPDGTLALDAVQYATQLLTTTTPVSLDGAGQVVLRDSPNNYIGTTLGGAVLVNNLEGGIRGAGQVCNNALSLVNNTTVTAEGSSGLTVDPPASGMENNGVMGASAGSWLLIRNGSVANEQGTLDVRSGAYCRLSSAVIVGGVLRGQGANGPFHIDSASALTDATVAPATVVNIDNSHVLHPRGTLTLGGELRINAVQYATQLLVDTPAVTLAGAGSVVLSDSPNNYFNTTVGGAVLTNNLAGGVRGSGRVGNNSLSLVNNTTVTAEGSAGLVLDPPASGMENNGVLRAAAGSWLTILNGQVDNIDGRIETAAGGACRLSGASIVGGTLGGVGGAGGAGGTFHCDSSSVLADVTVEAQTRVHIDNSHVLYPRGTVRVNGELRINAVQYATQLLVDTPAVTLAGAGSVVLSDSTNNYFNTTVGGAVLTNNLAGGVRGAGRVGNNSLSVVNNTTVTAEGSSGLILDPPASGMENNGVLRAAAGSWLTILNGQVDNTDGRIETAAGGACRLSGASIVGGTLGGGGGGGGGGAFYCDSSSALTNATIEPGTVVHVDNSHIFAPRGTINNRGVIRLGGVQYATQLYIDTALVTLTGGGEVSLSDSTNNYLNTPVGGARLVNENNRIHGSGRLGNNALAITNRGVVEADLSGGLVIDPPAGADGFFNDASGLVRASASTITVEGGVFRTRGTVQVDAGRMLRRNGQPFEQEGGLVRVDGELEVTTNSYLLQGGTLGGRGRVDSNVTHSGGSINPGASTGVLTIEGQYAMQPGGTLDIEIAGPTPGSGHDQLVVTGAASLGGVLRLTFIQYVPPAGTVIRVLSAGSRTGVFSAIQAPAGVVVNAVYNAGSVDLTFVCNGRSDFNRDGFLDFFDYDDFVACFETGVCPPGTTADFNEDGFADFFDYDDFVAAFELGC